MLLEGLCWIDHVWSSKVCVMPVIPPSICFVCVFVYQKLSPRLRAGSQVFARFMLFLCVILHTMWSGKSLQLICIYPLVCCACLPSL